MNADEICERLRQWETPIIARVEEERVLLDLRTVEPEQEAVIAMPWRASLGPRPSQHKEDG